MKVAATPSDSDAGALRDREVLLGVCGGVAAYKAADLCSKLVQAGAGVSVVTTRGAGAFVGATTFEALTGRPVHSETYGPKEHFRGEHIGLGGPGRPVSSSPRPRLISWRRRRSGWRTTCSARSC